MINASLNWLECFLGTNETFGGLMKTEYSDNDRHPKERTGNEDRFSREIFVKYNELFKDCELITS